MLLLYYIIMIIVHNKSRCAASTSHTEKSEKIHRNAPSYFQPVGEYCTSCCNDCKMAYFAATRKRRCGECKGCRMDTCGTCINCRDMKKYGGTGRKKKACSKKVCTASWTLTETAGSALLQTQTSPPPSILPGTVARDSVLITPADVTTPDSPALYSWLSCA